jgi:hypothetical protein
MFKYKKYILFPTSSFERASDMPDVGTSTEATSILPTILHRQIRVRRRKD